MIEIIKELNIEVSKPNVFQAVVAKQYDMNTRFIKATLVDDGNKIVIVPSGSTKVIINAHRADGESKGFDGVVNEDGTVTVPLHSWMLEFPGTVVCDISVIDTTEGAEKKLTTTSFTLIVEKAAWGGGDITSDPQYDVLVKLIDSVSEATESVNPSRFASTVTGVMTGSGVVRIDDASPIDHEMNVIVSGVDDPTSVTVKQYGRNLLSDYYHADGKELYGIVFTLNEDGSVTANAKEDGVASTNAAQFQVMRNYKDLPPGTYTASAGVDKTAANGKRYGVYGVIYTADGKKKTGGDIAPTAPTFTLEAGDYIYYLSVCVPLGEVLTESVTFYPMLELGTVASGWEERKTAVTYTPNADGTVTGVHPIQQTTTLLALGANISCEYNKDTNKALADAAGGKRWRGKKWVCVGDSITAVNGFTSKHYFDYISDATGIDTVNMGVGGTGYAKGGANNDATKTFYARIESGADSIANADIVTIMGGVNDPGAGMEIGTASDTGTDTLCGCVNAAIDAVYAIKLDMPLGIITSPPAKSQPPTDSTNFVTQLYSAIEEICRLRGIPFLDLYHCSGLRPWDADFIPIAYSKDSVTNGVADGLHPDERGHEIIAPKIKAFLETLIL